MPWQSTSLRLQHNWLVLLSITKPRPVGHATGEKEERREKEEDTREEEGGYELCVSDCRRKERPKDKTRTAVSPRTHRIGRLYKAPCCFASQCNWSASSRTSTCGGNIKKSEFLSKEGCSCNLADRKHLRKSRGKNKAKKKASKSCKTARRRGVRTRDKKRGTHKRKQRTCVHVAKRLQKYGQNE